MEKSLHAYCRRVCLKQYQLKAFIFCISLLFYLTSTAQTSNVSGTVTDEQGQTLIGVTVKVKDTKIGVMSDVKGEFKIAVPDKNAVLVFAYIGYNTTEIPLNGQTELNVKLKDHNNALQEIVVTGYGSQKRESITGAISSVTSKDIERVHGGST
ncbi:carboxypeptidase-like regulatory domain-containing protein [Pedobacter sp. NJ-S-72]